MTGAPTDEAIVELQVSIQEIDAYYGELDAATGVKAINYASGAAHSVFDQEAAHRAHMGRRDLGFRRAVQRKTRIERGLRALGPEDRHVLATAFTPRRWDWTDARSPEERKAKGERSAGEARLRTAFAFGYGTSICLLALAIQLPEARALLPEASVPSSLAVLRILEWEIGQEAGSPLVRGLRDAAEARLVQAIRAYERARREALDAERGEAEQAARARARARIALIQARA